MFSVGRAELKGFHTGGVGWGLPYNKDGGCLSYLSKVKKKTVLGIRMGIQPQNIHCESFCRSL